jgi:hypothetical protein
MKRPLRRYVEKFEALDFAAGTYHSRQLPRARYNGTDFLEYLSEIEWQDPETPLGECDTA